MPDQTTNPDLAPFVKSIATLFTSLGTPFNEEKVYWAFGRGRSPYLWSRDLVSFTQTTKEPSPKIEPGSPIDRIRQSFEEKFQNFPPNGEIAEDMRLEYSRLVNGLLADFLGLKAILAEIRQGNSYAPIDDYLDPPSVHIYPPPDSINALLQLKREHIALALRPTVVALLTRWLDGRVATTVEECFMGLPDKVNYDKGFLALWDDASKSDDQRFDIAYVTKQQMLNSFFVDKKSSSYKREVYLRNVSSAILLMFEWDVIAPWKLFQKERHLVNFDMVKAACDKARTEWKLRISD